MKKIPWKKSRKQQSIAKERMGVLFEQAKKKSLKEPTLSKRYVALARKMSMKFKVRIPPQFRRRFCRHCNAYFTSLNSRVRMRKQMVVYTCLKCKHIRRFRYKK